MYEAGSICLRIAIIPSWYNSCVAPARGSFVKAQAEGLHSRGHEVLLLVPDRDSDRRLLHPTESVENGLKCIRISVPSPWHRVLGFYLPSALASVFSKQISKFSPDVVHAHAVRPAGVLAACALKHTSIPFVLTEHSGPLKKFWWTPHGKRHIALAYQNASCLFAVSDFLRLEMVKHFGNIVKDATILSNGVNTDFFVSDNQPPARGKLLFVGALEHEKGLQILLKSLVAIPDSLKWTLTVVGVGAEDKSLRHQASKLGLSGIPEIAERILIERDLTLLEKVKCRYHISQLSSQKSIEVIKQRKEIIKFTSGVSINNLSLNENDIGDFKTFLKLSPPLRREEDRIALVQGLKDELIDVIVSDHKPEDEESKRLTFSQAATGASGIETLLSLSLELYHNGSLKLETIIKALTSNPAKILKINKGNLSIGNDADLCIVDIDKPWIVKKEKLVSKSKNTSIEDKKLQGKVINTFVKGKELFKL